MEKKTVLFVNAINQNHSTLLYLVGQTIADLESFDCKILEFNLYAHPINYCIDCKMCFKQNNSPCCNDGNFNLFAEQLLKVDVVIFSASVLWEMPPSILHATLDKLKTFLSSEAIRGGISIQHKKWGLIAETLEPHEVIDSVRDNISYIVDAFDWEFIGTVHGCKYDVGFPVAAEMEIIMLTAGIPDVEEVDSAGRARVQQNLIQKMAQWESMHKTRALID